MNNEEQTKSSATSLESIAVPASSDTVKVIKQNILIRRIYGAVRGQLFKAVDEAKKVKDERDAIKAQRDELLAALKYHQEQTRPIQRTIDAIAKAVQS